MSLSLPPVTPQDSSRQIIKTALERLHQSLDHLETLTNRSEWNLDELRPDSVEIQMQTQVITAEILTIAQLAALTRMQSLLGGGNNSGDDLPPDIQDLLRRKGKL